MATKHPFESIYKTGPGSRAQFESDGARKDSFEPAVVQMAPVPETESELHARYPKALRLDRLLILHRHGERTPLVPATPDFVPHTGNEYTRDCCSSSHVVFSEPPHANVVARYNRAICDLQEKNVRDVRPDSRSVVHVNPCEAGQLTNRGRTTMRGVGQYLRNLYVERLGFLPREWSAPEMVYLRSTEFPRTYQSLHEVLNGLYPIAARNPTVLQNLLTIHTRSQRVGETLHVDMDCARLIKLRREFIDAGAEWIIGSLAATPRIKNLFFKTPVQNTENIGSTAAHAQSDAKKKDPQFKLSKGMVSSVYDNVAAARAHGYPVTVTPREAQSLARIMSVMWFGMLMDPPSKKTHFARKLAAGRMIHEICEVAQLPGFQREFKFDSSSSTATDKENTKNGKTADAKVAILSAHDTTVAPLIAALGIWNSEWPVFGSTVTMEFFSNATIQAKSYWGRFGDSCKRLLGYGANDAQVKHTESKEKGPDFVRVLLNGTPMQMPACASKGSHRDGDPTLCTAKAFTDFARSMSLTNAQHLRLCASKGDATA